MMSGNRNPMSLSLLADSKTAGLGFLADKSDLIKAILAES
jgi:hypothetical protein